ncbi:MAG: hypothetical protein ACK47B_09220 [Armatimonadota bacterium]
MPLIKMATAARRARVGSANTIRRALLQAGVPLVTLSPGVFAVEEADLNRFLQQQQDEPPTPRPKPRPRPSNQHGAESSAARADKRKRRQ